MTSGLLLLGFWLVAAALFDYPSWRTGLLMGMVSASIAAWTESLRRARRLRGQRDQDMGVDYRA